MEHIAWHIMIKGLWVNSFLWIEFQFIQLPLRFIFSSISAMGVWILSPNPCQAQHANLMPPDIHLGLCTPGPGSKVQAQIRPYIKVN